MVLLGKFVSGLSVLTVGVAALFIALWVVATGALWIRQIMADTRTDAPKSGDGRSWLSRGWTIDGYDWRIALGLGVHIIAIAWLGSYVHGMAIAIAGLYGLLLIITRAPERGFSRY